MNLMNITFFMSSQLKNLPNVNYVDIIGYEYAMHL